MTTIAVVGAGKMGLPVACHMAARGGDVIACDVNPAVVQAINAGRCPVDEPGVAELLARARKDHRLRATTDTAAAVAESDAVVILVPVALTDARDADLSAMHAAVDAVARGLKRGTLVSIETTLPVGTTRQLAARLGNSGLRAEEDFALVFSPERVKSRHVLERLDKTPKVIGGLTAECARRGTEFYAQFLGAPVIDAGSLEAAEMTKLADMIYRDVNIALANELARYAEEIGVDFERVRQAANTSGEANLLLPGVGVGGHCTPIYPYFAIRDAERRGMRLPFAEHAREVNDGQAAHLLDRLEKKWGRIAGRKVLVLGLGFRPEVKEHLCSPAFLLREELARRGATVRLHDPHYTPEEIRAHGFEPQSRVGEPWAEAIVLNTAHAAYRDLDFAALARQGVRAIVDGRNLWDGKTVEAAGLVYVGVGC